MSEMEPGGDKKRQKHSFALCLSWQRNDREDVFGKISETGCKEHKIDIFITRSYCIGFRRNEGSCGQYGGTLLILELRKAAACAENRQIEERC